LGNPNKKFFFSYIHSIYAILQVRGGLRVHRWGELNWYICVDKNTYISIYNNFLADSLPFPGKRNHIGETATTFPVSLASQSQLPSGLFTPYTNPIESHAPSVSPSDDGGHRSSAQTHHLESTATLNLHLWELEAGGVAFSLVLSAL
jgi:hypothetical protein